MFRVIFHPVQEVHVLPSKMFIALRCYGKAEKKTASSSAHRQSKSIVMFKAGK